MFKLFGRKSSRTGWPSSLPPLGIAMRGAKMDVVDEDGDRWTDDQRLASAGLYVGHVVGTTAYYESAGRRANTSPGQPGLVVPDPNDNDAHAIMVKAYAGSKPVRIGYVYMDMQSPVQRLIDGRDAYAVRFLRGQPSGSLNGVPWVVVGKQSVVDTLFSPDARGQFNVQPWHLREASKRQEALARVYRSTSSATFTASITATLVTSGKFAGEQAAIFTAYHEELGSMHPRIASEREILATLYAKGTREVRARIVKAEDGTFACKVTLPV